MQELVKAVNKALAKNVNDNIKLTHNALNGKVTVQLKNGYLFIYLFIYLYNFSFICLNNTNYHEQTILHNVNVAGNPQQRHRPITAAPVNI